MPAGPRRVTGEAMRAVLTLVAVLATAAGILRGLDAVAGFLAVEPWGIVTYRNVEEAEAALGARLWLPSYFPEELEWPPAAVRATFAEGRVAALAFDGHATGRPRLIVLQTLWGEGPIPPSLLDSSEPLQTVEAHVGDRPATLSRSLLADGSVWHDLVWTRGGRRIQFRFRGPPDTLLMMARSVHEGRG